MAGILHRKLVLTACAFAMAAAAGGCAQQISGLSEAHEAGWFSKPLDVFSKPEWARTSNASLDTVSMRPVGPEDMVSAEGQCAPGPAEAAVPAPQPVAAAAPAGTGFNGSLQTGPGAPAAMAPAGGIALGMSECQAVRRAGSPSHVAISAGENGERRVVLTYLSGPWPGIYTFDSGRLKIVDAAPVQDRKPEPKKKPVKRAKTAARTQAPTAQ